MTANSDDIYIKADRNIEVAKKSVTLGDVLKIESSILQCWPESEVRIF